MQAADDHPVVRLEPFLDHAQAVLLERPGRDAPVLDLVVGIEHVDVLPPSWSDAMARSMTRSAGCGTPIGRRIRTNIPGDKQPLAPLQLGVRRTLPRTRMLPVVGLTWLLTKLIVPLVREPVLALQAHEDRHRCRDPWAPGSSLR